MASSGAPRMLTEVRQALAGDDFKAATTAMLSFARARYESAFDAEGATRTQRLEQAAEAARMARRLAQKLEVNKPQKTERASVNSSDDEETVFSPAERPKVRFADVAGLDDVKREIDLSLIRPLRFPEQARKLGVQAGGGLLLYGPPGTGKTLIARAVAGEVDAAFFSVKPNQIMSQWVGKAEQNIAALFDQARRHPRSVIFIDEVEALVPKRSSTRSTVMARVVPQILAEMEGFEEHDSALVFIGSTNQPWDIDEAMLRPGRLDSKVYVGLPDQDARAEIVRLHLRGRYCDETIDHDGLAAQCQRLSGADIANICERAARDVFEEITNGASERPIRMSDLLAEIGRTQPSVPANLVEKFERFRRTGQ